MVYFLVIFFLGVIGVGGYYLFFKSVPVEKKIIAFAKASNYLKIIEMVNNNKNLLERSNTIKFYYGKALYNFEHYKDALLYLSPLLKIENVEELPYYEDLLGLLGDINYVLGGYKESLFQYIKQLRINPNNKNALYHISRIYAAAGEFQKAIFHYNELKRLDRKNPVLYYELALCFILKNDFQEALASIKIALEFDETNIDYIFTLGVILFLKKNLDRSAKVLIDVTKKDNVPKDYMAESYRLLGNIYQKLNNFKYAINYYEEYIKYRKHSKPEYLKDVLYYLAFAYYKDKDFSNGERCFQILFNLDRNYKDINDIIYKIESISTNSEFIQALDNWYDMVESKFPYDIFESQILVSKNIDLGEIEERLGIRQNKGGGLKYSYDQYVREKYQNWVMINESLLKLLGFQNIRIHREPNDPDPSNGLGIYFAADKKNNNILDKYIIKFFRDRTFSTQIIEFCLDILERYKFHKIAVFYTGVFPMDIINKFNGHQNIQLFNRNALKELINKL